MLIFLQGSDFKAARKRLGVFVKDITQKKPNISLLVVTEENISDYDVVGLTQEQGLFEQEVLIVFDHMLTFYAQKEREDLLMCMHKSSNIFVILEGALDKKITDLAKKINARIEEFSLKERPITPFNPFSLGDALGARNRRQLWVAFYKAIQGGLAAEEISGIFFWQIKSIIIAKEAESLKESGLKPFVYTKAKKFASSFSAEELKEKLAELTTCYHRAHQGLTELPVALEKFILHV